MKRSLLKPIGYFVTIAGMLFLMGAGYEIHTGIAVLTVLLLSLVFVRWLPPASEAKAFRNQLVLLIFCGILFIPLLSRKETRSLENRNLAPTPQLNPEYIWSYFFEFQAWFEDRFGFRNRMIQTFSLTKLKVFQKSPMPQVSIGKEGWLFDQGTEYFDLTSKPFTESELKTIRENLHTVTRFFEQNGIRYYLFVAPVKARIYPEQLNPFIRKRMSHSRLDQLYQYLKHDTGLYWMDVRDVLVEGKQIRDTYVKTDTHWNYYGAFLAYTQLMNRLQKDYPSLKPYPESAFQLDSMETDGGDLQLLMGVKDVFKTPMYYLHAPFMSEPVIGDSTQMENPNGMYSIREMPNLNDTLKLVMVRDSYTELLRLYMAPHFKRSFYAWTPVVPVAKIMEERPHLVVHEILEHYIGNLLVLPPELKTQSKTP